MKGIFTSNLTKTPDFLKVIKKNRLSTSNFKKIIDVFLRIQLEPHKATLLAGTMSLIGQMMHYFNLIVENSQVIKVTT